MSIRCPGCGQKGRLPAGYEGERLRCPGCGTTTRYRIGGKARARLVAAGGSPARGAATAVLDEEPSSEHLLLPRRRYSDGRPAWRLSLMPRVKPSSHEVIAALLATLGVALGAANVLGAFESQRPASAPTATLAATSAASR